MVVLPLLHLFCLHNVWAQDGAISNRLEESPPKTTRGYQFYHEAIDSDARYFDWRNWGGMAVSITQAPYAVLYGWTCGGSLIAPNWVITAAHCGKEHSVYAGSEISANAEAYAVSRHVFHPGWFSLNRHYFDFDYQLVELSEFVPVTKRTRPIAIGGFEDLHAGQSVAISGWGYAEYKENITRETSGMSERLRQVWMTLIDTKECITKDLPYYMAKLNFTGEITPRMICAKSDNQGTCFGDSGGPVVANNRLVGSVSWGPHCEPLQIFSNVVKVKDWIRKTTKLTL